MMDKNKPIIALDFANNEELNHFLALFKGQTLNVKVGMEQYYSSGPALIEKLRELNHDIFLDLKLHDIPNTVKRSMSILAQLGVSMVNVHASGGSKMMMAAKEGLISSTPAGSKCPILIAVTQLTSTSEQQLHNEQNIALSMQESVVNYAQLAKKSGLDGVVASPWEVAAIRKQVSEDFITVTPGIRLESSRTDDQTRIATPYDAGLIGSHYIVVGRPITQANDPVAAYSKITQDWQNGCQDKTNGK